MLIMAPKAKLVKKRPMMDRARLVGRVKKKCGEHSSSGAVVLYKALRS
jgi:hypothetical protein